MGLINLFIFTALISFYPVLSAEIIAIKSVQPFELTVGMTISLAFYGITLGLLRKTLVTTARTIIKNKDLHLSFVILILFSFLTILTQTYAFQSSDANSGTKQTSAGAGMIANTVDQVLSVGLGLFCSHFFESKKLTTRIFIGALAAVLFTITLIFMETSTIHFNRFLSRDVYLAALWAIIGIIIMMLTKFVSSKEKIDSSSFLGLRFFIPSLFMLYLWFTRADKINTHGVFYGFIIGGIMIIALMLQIKLLKKFSIAIISCSMLAVPILTYIFSVLYDSSRYTISRTLICFCIALSLGAALWPKKERLVN